MFSHLVTSLRVKLLSYFYFKNIFVKFFFFLKKNEISDVILK